MSGEPDFIGVETAHWFAPPLPPNRTCGFPASGFPTGFTARPTATTDCARVEGIGRPIPRRHILGRIGPLHAPALCVVDGGSAAFGHRHADRRPRMPTRGRRRRSRPTNRAERGSTVLALRPRRPCCRAPAVRRSSP